MTLSCNSIQFTDGEIKNTDHCFLAKLFSERYSYVIIFPPNEIWPLMSLINLIKYVIKDVHNDTL